MTVKTIYQQMEAWAKNHTIAVTLTGVALSNMPIMISFAQAGIAFAIATYAGIEAWCVQHPLAVATFFYFMGYLHSHKKMKVS